MTEPCANRVPVELNEAMQAFDDEFKALWPLLTPADLLHAFPSIKAWHCVSTLMSGGSIEEGGRTMAKLEAELKAKIAKEAA